MVTRSLERTEEALEVTDERLVQMSERYLGTEIVQRILEVTPKEVILKRKARGQQIVDYVPIYYFINKSNALFGFNWDVVVTNHGILEEDEEVEDTSQMDAEEPRKLGPREKLPTKIVKIPTQVWVSGYIELKIPGRVAVEKKFDREGKLIAELETRIEPITIRKHAFGGKEIAYYGDGSGIIDIGDDLKGAQADMMKKAFSYAGFCRDVYGRREVRDSSLLSDKQITILIKRGGHLGAEPKVIREKIEKICTAEFGVNLNELPIERYPQLLKLIEAGQPKRTLVKMSTSP